MWRLLWEHIVEDRDLVFFFLTFLIWLSNFLSEVAPPAKKSLLWISLNSVAFIFFFIGVGFYVHKHRKLIRQLTLTKHIPVVCVMGKPDDEAQRTFDTALETIANITGFRAFKSVERLFNLQYNRALEHREEPLPPDAPGRWHDLITRMQERADRFADALPGKKLYHIFIQGPASLALGLGAVFGWKHPVMVYQWSGEAYEPVLDLRENPRRIKEKVGDEFQYLGIPQNAFENLTEDTALVLGMASHPPIGWVEEYLNKIGKTGWKCVSVENTYGGTLREDDWTRVVQELYTVFYELHRRKEVKMIHLFHSMPVAMAFGLGMALGTFVPITVYNWQSAESTYYPVLELHKLQSSL